MPDRDVRTLRDLIWYQYAKIIAKRALGPDAKREHYGFVKQTLRDLQSGRKQWSDISREDWQFVESEKQCIYCSSVENLSREHLVAKSLRINDRCATCDVIQSIHNQVWSCKSCNSQKGTMGLYAFYAKRLHSDKKFYDRIPPLAEKKYLKTIYVCLDKCTTYFSETPGGGKQPDVLALDKTLQVIGQLLEYDGPNAHLIRKWQESNTDASILEYLKYLDSGYELTEKHLNQAFNLFLQTAEDPRWDTAGYGEIEPGQRICLSEAFEDNPIDDTLIYFENADLFEVWNREAIMQYWIDDAPFYTLEELSLVTRKAIEHLERNREYLLQYGHSLSVFTRCDFLMRLTDRLYYTDCPSSLHRVRASQLDKKTLNKLFPHGNLPEPFNFVANADMAIKNPFHKMEPIDEISPQDKKMLIDGRNRFFSLKQQILQELFRSICSRSADGLWDRCVNLIREAISAEEAEFYLRVDRIYEGYDIQTDENNPDCGLIAGGLTRLLDTIWHYEKEITIGTIHHCKSKLNEVGLGGISEIGRGELYVSTGEPTKSYYAFINDEKRNILDAALDQFMILYERETNHWQEYRKRVNYVLENELYVDITIHKKIKRPLAYKYKPVVTRFAEYAKCFLEANPNASLQNTLGVSAITCVQHNAGGIDTSKSPEHIDVQADQERNAKKLNYQAAIEGNVLKIEGHTIPGLTRDEVRKIWKLHSIKPGADGKRRLDHQSSDYNRMINALVGRGKTRPGAIAKINQTQYNGFIAKIEGEVAFRIYGTIERHDQQR